MLMSTMLKEMRQSMLDGTESSGGLGAETMTETVDTELGRVLSRSGGFGLAEQLSQTIERQLGTAAPAAAPAPARPDVPDTVPAPSPAPPAGALSLPTGRTTSGFGWRRDPIDGQPRLHRGVDVAMAYGADVHAAAAGTVSFAGNRGTYGNLVVIDHADGRQTRYAHLSGVSVSAGEQVEAGQVIGQAGRSGRTTGTHLHFEVIADGHAVDPSSAKEARRAN